jgi:hypothetical protein
MSGDQRRRANGRVCDCGRTAPMGRENGLCEALESDSMGWFDVAARGFWQGLECFLVCNTTEINVM